MDAKWILGMQHSGEPALVATSWRLVETDPKGKQGNMSDGRGPQWNERLWANDPVLCDD
jgi:hypothetical protein